MASSSTLSPRNSSRSYEDARSGAQDECVKTGSARSGGSSSISRPSSPGPLRPLLVPVDVVDGLPDGLDLLGVFVRDLDPELVLELHDQLDEVEGVGVEILLEVRLIVDLALLHPELLAQDLLHALVDLLTRRRHLTSIRSIPGKSGRSYTGVWRPLREPCGE